MKTLLQHLKNRHVDLDLHKVYIDEKEYIATFPLINFMGKMVGYHQYRPDKDKIPRNNPKEGRYFTYIPKGELAPWGIESWDLSNVLFLTEGVFDAARFTDRGYSAIATFSYNPKNMKDLLLFYRSTRPVISICDSGTDGIKLAKYGHEYHVMPNEFDIGDAPDEYVEKVLSKYGNL